MKDSIPTEQSKIGGLADLYKMYQKSKEIDLEASKDILLKLSNKFKEYIIDEDEAEAILNLMRIAVKCDDIHLCDRLDIVYKYTRLYFKCQGKQCYQQSDTNFKEDAKEDVKEDAKEEKECLSPNSEKYLEAISWLFDCIDRILSQCDRDVTQLQGYLKKQFLLMASMYIVSLEFPHKYGFLSLDPEKLLKSKENKVGELEGKLIDCILAVEYNGNILCMFKFWYRGRS